jgi:hypothetical protein
MLAFEVDEFVRDRGNRLDFQHPYPTTSQTQLQPIEPCIKEKREADE